jgi:SNF2 family DNA or RNA helicase
MMPPYGPLTLDPFQHEVVSFMDVTAGRCIYADDVGGRKTGTTLTWLSQQTDLPRTLVVAPKAVHGHWRREAARFFPAAEVGMPGRTREDRHIGYDLVRGATDPVIQLTTYESMKLDEDKIIRANFQTVVFDEGHVLKGRRTAVALTANKLAHRAECCLVVTGTPIMNHADETWQYLHMLWPKQYPSFKTWVEANFHVEYTTFHGKLPRPVRVVHDLLPERVTAVRAQLAKVSIQRQISDLFPGEVWTQEPEHTVIDVTMRPAEKKAYDRLVKHGWGMVGDVEIATDNKLALWTRLRQLSSDMGTIDSASADGSKVAAAAELIENLARRESIVAFTGYRETAHRLAARLNEGWLKAAAYTGELTEGEREDLVARFGSGDLDVLVGTLAALGTGVDGLQVNGSTVVFLDRDWNPAVNAQAVGRRRRSGQRERVSVYHLMYDGTIDVAVVQACLDKTNVIETLADRPLSDVIYGRGFKLLPSAGSPTMRRPRWSCTS